MTKRFFYTKANVQRSMQLYQAEHGYAPNSQSGVITHGDLVNGKRTWLDVCNAFIRGSVKGVDKDIRMHNFIENQKFRTRSIYTKAKVKQAMRLFYQENAFAPERYSGVIKKGKLADGVRTWENVYGAFKRGTIEGVEKDISMPEFAKANGFKKRMVYTYENTYEAMSLYILKHGDIPHRSFDLIEQGELANGSRAWIDIYNAFYRNLVRDVYEGLSMSEFARSIFDQLKNSGRLDEESQFAIDGNTNELKPLKFERTIHSPITSKDVFNVVAAQLANANRLISNKIFDPTAPYEFDRHKHQKIENGLTDSNPITLLGYTWERLLEEISLGYVVDLPHDFDLARYASKVESRIKGNNYQPPSQVEIMEWMKLTA